MVETWNDSWFEDGIESMLVYLDNIEITGGDLAVWTPLTTTPVTLRGNVESLVEWHLAQETARGVYGVRAVINELDVRRRAAHV